MTMEDSFDRMGARPPGMAEAAGWTSPPPHGVTRHPTDAWVARQLGEATPFDRRPTYLVRDNDSQYGSAFARVVAATGIEELRTAYRTPRQNATCERFLGSVRRECLDHLLVLGGVHLRRTLREYVAYLNRTRPH